MSRQIERMCGKTRFNANRAWARVKRLRKLRDDLCHAYHCCYCGYYHIGCDRRLVQKALGAGGFH